MFAHPCSFFIISSLAQFVAEVNSLLVIIVAHF